MEHGVSVIGVIGIVLIILKIVGIISWSWVWVLAPLWIPILMAISLWLLLIIFGISKYK